jgi:hypothetical protein
VTAAFTLDRGRILLNDAVFVYLERAPRPTRSLVRDDVPRPHGVASIARLPEGQVVAAADDREVIWLGFQPLNSDQSTVVRVRVDRVPALDAVTGAPWDDAIRDAPRNHLVVPPDSRLVGLPANGEIRPFAAPERLSIFAGVPPLSVTVRLVQPTIFARLTGKRPAPLDPDAAYTGWRAL